MKNLIGLNFHNWIVIGLDRTDFIVSKSNKKYRCTYWNCRCQCGKIKSISTSNLTSGKTRSCSDCSWKVYKEKHPKWKGFEGITGVKWRRIVQGAESRNIKVRVTKQQIWQLFVDQKGKCNLSGLSISLGNPDNASLDRIDSVKHYTIDNIQWIHKDINRMKNAYDQNYFIEMCKLISKYNKITK